MRPLLPLVLVAATGCVELTEPNIPDRRAPAVLQANMRIFDAGIFQVDGSLAPGREDTGFLRIVQVPFIQAGQFVVEPRELTPAGTRLYHASFPVPRNSTDGPFELVVPDVRGVTPLAPVRWWGLRRIGPDTVVVRPGSDVAVRIDTVAAPSVPQHRARQWFLEIVTGVTVFRISGDQMPPLTLRIPAEWIPGRAGGSSRISLIYLQTAQLRAPDSSYIANVKLDTRLNWIVHFRDGAPQ
jgi:hypothetical protein